MVVTKSAWGQPERGSAKRARNLASLPELEGHRSPRPLVGSLVKLLYGWEQREAQRLARDTLGEEEPGQISLIFMENGERHFETQEDPALGLSFQDRNALAHASRSNTVAGRRRPRLEGRSDDASDRSRL